MRNVRRSVCLRALALLLAGTLAAGLPFLPFGTGDARAANDEPSVAVLGVHGHPDADPDTLEDLADVLTDSLDGSRYTQALGLDDYGRSVWDRRTPILQGVFLGSAQSAFQEGRILYDNAQFMGALSSLEKAQGTLERGIEFMRDPKLMVEIHLYLGLTNMALGDTEVAGGYFEDVARTDPARSLDPVRTPPKMLEAFEEARARVTESGSASVEVGSGKTSGADVFVNGMPSGQTPAVLDLPPGRYHITVHHPERGWDYSDETVAAEEVRVLSFQLEDRGIRRLGREKAESPRSRRVQALYRELGEAVAADLLLMASLDQGDNLHMQLYSPRSDVFSQEVLGLVAPGGIVDVSAVDELVHQLVELVDEGGGIRPDATSATLIPIHLGRNPTLNGLLTGPEPRERVVVRNDPGDDDDDRPDRPGPTGPTKPVHKRPAFWVVLGTAVAGGVAAGIAGASYAANQQPTLGNGTVTVVIDP
jgi:hypothetical protein